MIIDKKLEDAINQQINAEFFSSYLYLSMASYFDSKSFKGFSNWMKVQAQEEMVHAMKFYQFVFDRGGKVELKKIDQPTTNWSSPLAAFEEAYQHEQKVTALIHGLVKLARENNDYSTEVFLQWFVSEQIEEEASASEIIEQLKRIGEQGNALFMIDKELAARVFTPPAAGSAT